MSSSGHEFSALTGAYVLDALDPRERAAFEDHLAACAECSAEVRSLRGAATELSHASASVPPPRLRAEVLADIGQVRPLPPTGENLAAARSHAARRWLWQAVAAACVLLAAAAGAWGYQQHQDANRSHDRASLIIRVLESPDAHTVTGRFGTGHATIVYSSGEHRMLLIGHDITAPPDDKTYQLWMISSVGRATSAGVFTPDADGGVLVQASGDLTNTAKLGVSIEPSGGSPQPTPGAIIAQMPI